ncbi:472_t:CDS:2, partial [Ambispora gerdemannii]
MSQASSSSSSSSNSSNGSPNNLSNTVQSQLFSFQDNEKVLCYHGPMLYAATVKEVNSQYVDASGEAGLYYKIHYHGWNSRSDEWVPQNRILKMNEENMILQNTLQEELKNRPSAVAARANAAANQQESNNIVNTAVPMEVDEVENSNKDSSLENDTSNTKLNSPPVATATNNNKNATDENNHQSTNNK